MSVAIVGMHRSGTSLVARLCNLLGVDLGPQEQMVEPLEENPEGFWENKPLQRLNKRLLAHFGGDWEHPPLLAHGWEHAPDLEAFRTRARKLLADLATTDDGRPVGFKDPRTCLTLPFWASLGAADTVVCVIRDPLEIATSLETRNGTPREHALVLWNRYTVAALAQAPEALVVAHSEVFTDTDRVVADLGKHLGMTVDDEVLAAAREAVRPDLYRSRPAEPSDSPTGAFSRALYEQLVSGPRPDPAFLAELHGAYNAEHVRLADEGRPQRIVPADRLGELATEARRSTRRAERFREALVEERRRAADLERELAAVYESRTWRTGRALLAVPTALRRRLRS